MNPLEKLKEMKQNLNPQSAMMAMAANMIPGLEKQFVEKLEGMEKPESEGGKLPEGWDKIAYSIVTVNGLLNLSVHAIKVADDGMMLMSQPFSSFPLIELLNSMKNGKTDRTK